MAPVSKEGEAALESREDSGSHSSCTPLRGRTVPHSVCVIQRPRPVGSQNGLGLQIRKKGATKQARKEESHLPGTKAHRSVAMAL